jgi:NhaP-type Na+/H+ or K+/H+ antiporter
MTGSPAVTVAVALAAGMIVQAIAFHLSVPGIALLLVVGYLLGPDLLHLVNPVTLGSGLHTLVGLSMAVILFEGGLNLSLARLKREQLIIRRLVLVGGALTALLASLIARLLLGWPFRTALLFGTLVMVTGPTVVTPLLRRVRVKRHLATILEAEGIILDALGALAAVVVLELVLDVDLSARSLAVVLGTFFARLGTGVAFGIAGGGFIVLLLRFERLVPERSENVTVLGLAIATAQISSGLVSESGIVAAVVAGMVVGHFQTRVQRELREFKEQLTTMLISMLFILLAAGVRRRDLIDLGRPAIVAVLLLMFVVRPLAVLVSARGTDLGPREKAFLAWLGPRGIIAAAVASLFAETMEGKGLAGGDALRAMVFVVIASTVLLQGLSAAAIARLLGVREPDEAGYVIVGANGLGRLFGCALRTVGRDAIFIDADPEMCRLAEEEGFRVVYGSALDQRTLQRAGLESNRVMVAITKNEGVNVLSVGKARTEFYVRRGLVGVDRRRIAINSDNVSELGARVLFGSARDLKSWIGRADRGAVALERWRLAQKSPDAAATAEAWASESVLTTLLPLVAGRGHRWSIVDGTWSPDRNDEVFVAVAAESAAGAHAFLEAQGWQRTGAAGAPTAVAQRTVAPTG